MVEFKSNIQLQPTHPFYYIADSEGALVLPPAIRAVRDATDYSLYTGDRDGPRRDDLRANHSHRWQGLHGRRRMFSNTNGENAFVWGAYITGCLLLSSTVDLCVLYDTYMDNCVLSSCNIYFTSNADVSNCEFRNCVLTTAPDCDTVLCCATRLDNCTLKGNFAEFYGSSDLQRISALPALSDIGPYELYNNIVFKDRVVDLLRRWVYRFRIRRKAKCTAKKRALLASANSHHSWKYYYVKYKQADDARRWAEDCGWKTKAAGKRSLHINEEWNIGEQLEMPERRFQWMVSRYTEDPEPSTKKRKVVDLDG